MTDQRKDDMPEVWISWKETIKQKNTDNFNVHLWPCVFDHKRDYAVKYIRADLSPPVPVDTISIKKEVLKGVHDCLDMLHTGGAEEGTPYEDWARSMTGLALASLDAVLSEGGYGYMGIKMTEDKPVSKPVDTLAVPREVLQGVREALEKHAVNWTYKGEKMSNDEYKALASLDAVLSEGE